MLYKNLNFFVYKVRLYCLLYMKIVANTNENHNFCVFELRNKMESNSVYISNLFVSQLLLEFCHYLHCLCTLFGKTPKAIILETTVRTYIYCYNIQCYYFL